MVLGVEIISKQTIKPSSPTPCHLQCFKLSLLDQLTPLVDVPVILFYPADCQRNVRSDQLKKSLAKALTRFYPLGGRIKVDGSSIDCNDAGADYFEAKIDGQLKPILERPEVSDLKQLLPYPSHRTSLSANPSDQAILAVQVNIFQCGGIAMGVSISHKIADASSLSSFLNCWAAIARGAPNESGGTIIDCTSLFPPGDVSLLGGYMARVDENLLPNIVTKRFMFAASEITALREEIAKNSDLEHYISRVQAVSTHIWGSIIRSYQQKQLVQPNKKHVALHLVDLRRRMIPRLPHDSLGNICQISLVAKWPVDQTVDYNGLAAELRESINKISDGYVRNLHAENWYLNLLTGQTKEPGQEDYCGIISFSSWCRFPFYETDFGWGKPIWVATTCLPINNVAYLIDTASGDGVEAWISMLDEDMAKLEADPQFLAFVSHV